MSDAAPSPFIIHVGDCREVLRGLPDNSVDAIVTDPPYGLEFMGKDWDAPWRHGGTVLEDAAEVGGFQDGAGGNPYSRSRIRYGRESQAMPAFQLWCEEWATECFRVLKHGGHLLAFGGSRTYHRLACAVEDAGLEIRDQIMWVYGSGFPKSLDISKAIDRKRHDREEIYQVTKWIREARDAAGIGNRDIDEAFSFSGMAGHWTSNKSQPAVPTLEQVPRLLEVLGLTMDAVPDEIRRLLWDLNGRKGEPSPNWWKREVVGKGKSAIANKDEGERHTIGASRAAEFDLTAPATEAAKRWEGWGTALKPAHEPIVVARKPLRGTVSENVLAYGTGGLNINGCRIPMSQSDRTAATVPQAALKSGIVDAGRGGDSRNGETFHPANGGRFPANFIHDGSDEVLEHFPQTKAATSCTQRDNRSPFQTGTGKLEPFAVYDDGGGSAARFFYCAKASRRDRDEGLEEFTERRDADRIADDGVGGANPRNRTNTPRKNIHPTVKPTDLMRYLCRLVTPPNGTVLDPFTGSGSTGKAAVLEGFRFIGIEQSAEYAAIANARISYALEHGDETRSEPDAPRDEPLPFGD